MASTSWLDGSIRVRFPENVNSDLGLHFLDNAQPELKRVSKVTPPAWQRDPANGELSYQVRTAEGIHFAGRARAEGETIHMTFTIENRSGGTRDLTSQVCLDMSAARVLSRCHTLEGTFTWVDGQPRGLASTRGPLQAAKLAKTGFPWMLMLYREQPGDEMRRIEHECPWWIADDKPDYPLLARVTADRRHLVAISWGEDTVKRLMTNTSIPCLHSDPLDCKGLADGASKTWHGRVFLTANDPQRLLWLYKQGPNQK